MVGGWPQPAGLAGFLGNRGWCFGDNRSAIDGCCFRLAFANLARLKLDYF
jgi:hypothetical protein